jgi:RNA polymerase sigma-70 factor (ECF subfamily)
MTEASEQSTPPGDRAGSPFWPETRITYLGQIGSDDPVVRAHAAARLCELYRTPVLRRIRATWPLLSEEDAEDRCQQFFTDEIIAARDGGLFAAFKPAAGRLRTFLGIALQRFLSSAWRDETRQKRGGGATAVPLDENDTDPSALAESLPAVDTPAIPDFDREWAHYVLAESFRRLEGHYLKKPERAARYTALRPWLLGDPAGGSLADLAKEMGLGANQLSQALHRLRRDWRLALESVILPTLASPEDMDDELRYLLEILRQ